jgi:molybdopterin converting factor small subunit
VNDIVERAGTSDADWAVLKAAGELLGECRKWFCAQKLLHDELKRVNVQGRTLEALVRLGYEMEVFSLGRCAELLGESVQAFQERGWVQSRIRDALVDAESRVDDGKEIRQILKDFE